MRYGEIKMFEGFSMRTIDFMWDIRFNNRKDWFDAHKEEYKASFQQPMQALAQDVFSALEAKHPNKGFICKVSRIYKDARRLHGSGPYRDHLWFSVRKPTEEWSATPTFWFELGPEEWSFGLGYFMAKPATMEKFRARIDKDPKAFEKLVAPLEKQEVFELTGPEYVRVKVAPTPKTAKWYNKKYFSLTHKQKNSDALFSPSLVSELVQGFEMLMPMYDYLLTLDADPTPK
ncbi:DUF2461 domain-containing protein [Ruminococcaceae bacterium OttesenSCG-928-N02]|nr:DUF2461 domain-containing protein [Ruminococcaceae bacterium OttesenSCG-928-N02]